MNENKYFTQEEIELMKSVAIYHDDHTITEIDFDNLFEVSLRLIDFECTTAYREYHGFSEDLNDRLKKFMKDNRNALVSQDALPVLGLMAGEFDFMTELTLKEKIIEFLKKIFRRG